MWGKNMPRDSVISNAKTAQTLTTPGKHNAGDNLYLINKVRKTSKGSVTYRYWCLIYSLGGKRREMVLGSAEVLSLAEARKQSLDARQKLSGGIDPLRQRAAERKAAGGIPTFEAFADEYIQSHEAKFRNAKHIAQWKMTLGDSYCRSIRSRPVNEVDTEAVLQLLKPIWSNVPETASRLRGRLENIFDAAKVRGLYNGENPARWRGHLKALLPARQRLTRGHHAALPYRDLPAFMASLRERVTIAARALEFCILTATRSGETLGARWDEIDFEQRVWIIPAGRMKAGYEHRVPLSEGAMALLLQQSETRAGDLVFPGRKPGIPLSPMTMAMQLRRLGHSNVTVHGFRSTFRDWAAEQTNYSHETCEQALAHRISDKAEAAYRRGDQLAKRRMLMVDWANYAETKNRISHEQHSEIALPSRLGVIPYQS